MLTFFQSIYKVTMNSLKVSISILVIPAEMNAENGVDYECIIDSMT